MRSIDGSQESRLAIERYRPAQRARHPPHPGEFTVIARGVSLHPGQESLGGVHRQGAPSNSRSLVRSTFSTLPQRLFRPRKCRVDSARYPFPIWCSLRSLLRPQSSVLAQLPRPSGRLYITDAVMRRTSSPGRIASGLVRCAIEYCTLQFCAGLTVTRVDQESILPASMSQRSSSGSRPWKPEASKRSLRYVRPAVITSSAMWVESSR